MIHIQAIIQTSRTPFMHYEPSTYFSTPIPSAAKPKREEKNLDKEKVSALRESDITYLSSCAHRNNEAD